MSETAIMLAIRDEYVRSGKLWVHRNNTGRIGRVSFGLGLGGADLVGLLRGPGRGFACEVKRPGESLRPEQRCWKQGWEAAGGVYVVAHSVDEAMAELERAERA